MSHGGYPDFIPHDAASVANIPKKALLQSYSEYVAWRTKLKLVGRV
jgi:hypothetical protein